MKHAPLWLLIQAALLAAAPAGAQQTDTTVRPKLDVQADTNDWRAYFQYGMTHLRARPSKADAAFYWAARLGPNRAEPLYGRWVAFWLRNLSVFEDYMYGTKDFPEAEQAESLQARAVWRNPLMPQTLNVMIYDKLPGEWAEDPLTRGLLLAAAGRNAEAVVLWGRAEHSEPKFAWWVRYNRAVALGQLQQYDSAIAELRTLVSEAARRDTNRILHWYSSRESIHYAIGQLHIGQGTYDSARADFQQSLLENLAYAPAHAALGELALAGDAPRDAVKEFAQAVELVPGDVWYRYRLGAALVAGRQPDSAASVLADVVQREPLLAIAYYDWGRACEMRRDTATAVKAYRGFLARAARRDSVVAQWATERLQVLPGK
jgi:tetratricopeptide (TPR) repeat protein